MKRQWMSRLNVVCISLLTLMGVLTAEAGNPWLTGRTMNEQTVPVYLLRDQEEEAEAQPLRMADGISAMAATPATGGLIDIVVSIYTNKPGDNKGNVQGGDDNAAQDNFERIIQHFADGVYEMSEGAHRLRNVRIFQNGEQANQADVVWLKTGGTPHVPAKGGVGEVGGKIMMYDVGVWDGGTTYDFLANEKAAGYTLAHEWGHYFYGVYDEYKINNTDVVVTPSIMNSQWRATDGDMKWLNFSVAYTTNRPTGDFVNTRRTAQHREMNASCWETIARNPTNDPSSRARFDLGRRIFYPEVAAVAPTGTNSPAINLPSPAAREHLNILWDDPALVTVLVLDRSGSMGWADDQGRVPMNNLKVAVAHLLDSIPVSNHVGIISFDSSVRVDAPIRMIASDADRAALKNIVNGLYASGGTMIGAAAQRALTEIQAFLVASNAVPVVFLLTDGYSSDNPLSVVPAYQNAQIPIMGFGYIPGGSTDVDARLPQMAQQTGGKYYASPTDYTTIARAFQDAMGYVGGKPSVAGGSQSVPPGRKDGDMVSFRLALPIDSTLSGMTWTLSYNGDPADADLQLFAPKSKTGIDAQVSSASGQSLWLFTVTDPQPGSWEVRGSVTGGKTVDYLVTATEGVITYGLRTEIIGGNAVVSPSPVTIVAYLSRGMPISGATVTATITDPNGEVTVLPLANVDGGEYRGTYMSYGRNGSYSVDVVAENKGRARLTFQGAILAPHPDGEVSKKGLKDIAISERFSRSASEQFTISGVTHSPRGAVSTWTPTFLWPGDTNAVSYLLEVNNSATGKRVLRAKTKAGVNTFVPKKPLPTGNYEWSVQTTRRVMVADKKGKMKPATTNIVSAIYSFNRGAITPGSLVKIAPAGEEMAGEVYLQWQADANATSYLITVRQSKDGQTFAKGKTYRFVPTQAGADRFMLKKAKPGFYQWFIQGVSPDGAGVPDTNGMSFEVK